MIGVKGCRASDQKRNPGQNSEVSIMRLRFRARGLGLWGFTLRTTQARYVQVLGL